jgi:hypothetical protein
MHEMATSKPAAATIKVVMLPVDDTTGAAKHDATNVQVSNPRAFCEYL